jgi:hypothetical protein
LPTAERVVVEPGVVEAVFVEAALVVLLEDVALVFEELTLALLPPTLSVLEDELVSAEAWGTAAW